jgi:hypothetical protein
MLAQMKLAPAKPCPTPFFGFCHEGTTGGMMPNLLSAYSLCDKRMWQWMEAEAGFMGYCLDAPEMIPTGSVQEQGQRMIFRT